jgi:hypothetical protein
LHARLFDSTYHKHETYNPFVTLTQPKIVAQHLVIDITQPTLPAPIASLQPLEGLPERASANYDPGTPTVEFA